MKTCSQCGSGRCHYAACRLFTPLFSLRRFLAAFSLLAPSMLLPTSSPFPPSLLPLPIFAAPSSARLKGTCSLPRMYAAAFDGLASALFDNPEQQRKGYPCISHILLQLPPYSPIAFHKACCLRFPFHSKTSRVDLFLFLLLTLLYTYRYYCSFARPSRRFSTKTSLLYVSSIRASMPQVVAPVRTSLASHFTSSIAAPFPSASLTFPDHVAPQFMP